MQFSSEQHSFFDRIYIVYLNACIDEETHSASNLLFNRKMSKLKTKTQKCRILQVDDLMYILHSGVQMHSVFLFIANITSNQACAFR